MSVLSWIVIPAVLVIGLLLYLFALTAAGWVVLAAWRGLRFQVARRFRKVLVPQDGEPLDDREKQSWEDIVNGRKRRGREPAYEEWGES